MSALKSMDAVTSEWPTRAVVRRNFNINDPFRRRAKDHQRRSPMPLSEQKKILLDSITNYGTMLMLDMVGMYTMRLRIMSVPLGFRTLK